VRFADLEPARARLSDVQRSANAPSVGSHTQLFVARVPNNAHLIEFEAKKKLPFRCLEDKQGKHKPLQGWKSHAAVFSADQQGLWDHGGRPSSSR